MGLRMRSRGVVAIGCLLLVACGSSGRGGGPAPDQGTQTTYAIVGSVTRRFEPSNTPAALESASTRCLDLDGAEVRVLAVDGDLVGDGHTSTVQTDGASCIVTFAVEVPREPAYTVSVADLAGPTYTFDELKELAFRLELEQAVTLDESDLLPNVLGLKLSRATAELSAYGIVPEVSELCLQDESFGVVGQDPPGGSFPPADGVVVLTVNQLRQVPWVVNMPEDRATARLQALGFVVELKYVNNNVFRPGRVDDQRDPTFGCPGDTVELLVEV